MATDPTLACHLVAHHAVRRVWRVMRFDMGPRVESAMEQLAAVDPEDVPATKAAWGQAVTAVWAWRVANGAACEHCRDPHYPSNRPQSLWCDDEGLGWWISYGADRAVFNEDELAGRLAQHAVKAGVAGTDAIGVALVIVADMEETSPEMVAAVWDAAHALCDGLVTGAG